MSTNLLLVIRLADLRGSDNGEDRVYLYLLATSTESNDAKDPYGEEVRGHA